MADRLFAIHKLHANYGRVFSEWSALEKNMGDTLQVKHKCSSIVAFLTLRSIESWTLHGLLRCGY